jgi:multiple sugar transport system permease protein
LCRRLWAGRQAYLFLAPPVIAFFVFVAYPAAFALYASFFKFNNLKLTPLDAPFDNYARALRDPLVQRAFLNVLELFFISFAVGQTLSLLIAVLLDSLNRMVILFRTIYYLPMVTSVVIVGALFRFLLRQDASGPANVMLSKLFGIGPIRWLTEESLLIPSVALVTIWATVGGNVIIWTAGLKGVPREVYEAATLDGVSPWRQFWGVTLPMLKPIAIYQAVLGFIGGMKAFGLNYTMVPQNETTMAPTCGATPVLLIWQYGFRRMQMGYASAVAYLLSFSILAVSALQLRLYGEADVYD